MDDCGGLRVGSGKWEHGRWKRKGGGGKLRKREH